MFRNKEIRLLLLSMGVITIIATIGSYFISQEVSIFVFFTCVLFMSTAILFSYWRYREIEKLSVYLRKISKGNFQLDVRDNNEGELSILKNEIYKVTNMLSEQGAYLQKDKEHLTNAISDISHQLKTPLTSMKMMVDLLSNDELPDEKRLEFTYTIRMQLERIKWLVSSLLKLSKIDAGTVHFKREIILVHELIETAVETLLIPLEIKDQTLSVHGNKDVHYIGDFNWTVEAMINLLKNSVEHTAEGGKINVSFSENALYTEMVISDNGRGIPKEDLPYIFKRFYKGKSTDEDSVGIGLALAYSIVAEQDGDIKVESDGETGTTFTVKFYKRG